MNALWILWTAGTALAAEPVAVPEEPVPDADTAAPPVEHSVRRPAEKPDAVRPAPVEGLVPDALEGLWWLVDDDREEAIDALASELPFYLRPMARTRLRAVTFPCDAVKIEELGELVSITCDDRLPAVGPLGETVEYAEGVRLTLSATEDSLVQTYTRRDGVRRNVYTTRGDGGLRLEVTVRSPRLPRELVYERTFTRDGRVPEPPSVTRAEAPPTPAPGS